MRNLHIPDSKHVEILCVDFDDNFCLEFEDEGTFEVTSGRDCFTPALPLGKVSKGRTVFKAPDREETVHWTFVGDRTREKATGEIRVRRDSECHESTPPECP